MDTIIESSGQTSRLSKDCTAVYTNRHFSHCSPLSSSLSLSSSDRKIWALSFVAREALCTPRPYQRSYSYQVPVAQESAWSVRKHPPWQALHSQWSRCRTGTVSRETEDCQSPKPPQTSSVLWTLPHFHRVAKPLAATGIRSCVTILPINDIRRGVCP